MVDDCIQCNGTGEVLKMTPRMRSRFVAHDDLCPSDFGEECKMCNGTGSQDSCHESQ